MDKDFKYIAKLMDTVVKGDGLAGPVYGASTANLIPHKEFELEHGVYAAIVECNGWRFHGALSYGGDPEKFEVHLLSFQGDLVGKVITVYAVEKVSEFLLWQSKERLRQKIRFDILAIRDYFDQRRNR